MRKTLMFMLMIFHGCAPLIEPSIQDQSDALNLVDSGVVYLREGQLDRAEANFEIANEIMPMAAAIDGLGCVAFLRGDTALAESLFWQAYEMDSSYNTSLGNLALLYEHKGETEKAEEFYNKALVHDTKNFKTRNNYAAFLYDKRASKTRVLAELLKAEALFGDVKIYDNIHLITKEK